MGIEVVSVIAGVVLGGLIWSDRVTDQLRGVAIFLIASPLVYGLLVLMIG